MTTTTKKPCVIFPGPYDKKGYGRLWSGTGAERRCVLAHRQAFLDAYGHLPSVVMHDCDTPACIEPTHLLPGTVAKNNADMAAKGRARNGGTCGEDHPRAKVSDADVVSIRQQLAAGTPRRVIAERYGIGKATVQQIASGKRKTANQRIERRPKPPLPTYSPPPRRGRSHLLTSEQERSVADRKRTGDRAVDLAREFGVSLALIYVIEQRHPAQDPS